MFGQQFGAESLPCPEGTRKRSSTNGQVEACGPGVQMRPAARRRGVGVRHDNGRTVIRPTGDHTEQLTPRGPLPAPHASPDRTGDALKGRGFRCASHWNNLTPMSFRTRKGLDPAGAGEVQPTRGSAEPSRHRATPRIRSDPATCSRAR